MEKKVIKIGLTGPESTGKSTLSAQLALHFQTLHTVEFARQYLEERNNLYSNTDIIYIAEKQLELENIALAEANQLLFCDTDFINFKIWFEHLNNDVPDWIENYIQSKPYALTLLMAPDIPWEQDPLREYPDKREYFFNLFKKNLEAYDYPFVIIEGKGEARFANALKAVESFLQNN